MAVAPPASPQTKLLPLTRSRSLRVAAGVVFWPALALWTWKLLEPHPVPEGLVGELHEYSEWLPFLFAKLLHVLGNAFLAGLIWLWVPPGRWRAVAVALLMAHGIATEIGQTYVPNRHGGARDVLIDWVGVGLGLVVARWATGPRSLRGE